MCCNDWNKLSFNERVQCYISKKEEIEAEYKSKLKALKEEAAADILANCPIKIGDVYVTEFNKTWGKRDNIFMFIVSIHDNFAIEHYEKVENYVEPSKD